MAGVKGRSGTNKGKDKPWAEALRVVVFREDADGKRRLLRIAEECAAAAEAGDIQAIKEIGDRLDGKPAQESTMTVRSELDSMNDVELREFIRRELEAASGSGAAAQEQPDTRLTH